MTADCTRRIKEYPVCKELMGLHRHQIRTVTGCGLDPGVSDIPVMTTRSHIR